MKPKILYLGWDNPKSAVYMPGVLVLHDKGETRALLGPRACTGNALLSELSAHLCGVRYTRDAALIIERATANRRDKDPYNAIFADLWADAVATQTEPENKELKT